LSLAAGWKVIKMTKELLMEIITKKLFFELIVILITYSTLMFVFFKLSSPILGTNITFGKTLPGIFTLVLFTLFGRLILPHELYGLVFIGLLVISLKVIIKVKWINSVWTGILVVFIDMLGTFAIQAPLCSFNANIADFILTTPLGVVLGTLIEMLFPLIALFVLSTLNVSIIPSLGKKTTFIDIVAVLTFATLFYWVYSASCRLLISLNNNPKHIIPNLISEGIAAVGSVLGFYIIHVKYREQRESERKMHQEEKTELTNFINTLLAYHENPLNNETDPQKMIDSIGIIVNKLNNVKQEMINEKNQRTVTVDAEKKKRIYFSPKETKVIELIVQGKSNKEIGAALKISEGTVKNKITDILVKTELDDRVKLAVFAVRHGIVKDDIIDQK
jgi:DNA-binding CsgD family transcriptional regulator